MAVDYDPPKGAATRQLRGLEMGRAGEVFDRPTLTAEDTRRDYSETCWITIGFLDGRMVALAWTWRNGRRRIISMRKTNAREQAVYAPRFK